MKIRTTEIKETPRFLVRFASVGPLRSLVDGSREQQPESRTGGEHVVDAPPICSVPRCLRLTREIFSHRDCMLRRVPQASREGAGGRDRCDDENRPLTSRGAPWPLPRYGTPERGGTVGNYSSHFSPIWFTSGPLAAERFVLYRTMVDVVEER